MKQIKLLFLLTAIVINFTSLTIKSYSKLNDTSDFVPNHCGTYLSKEIKQKKIKTLGIELDSNGRFIMQCSIKSKSGFFVIHYDTSGQNAVPSVDLNSNGIPDYVDSAAYYFDFAKRMEIDSIGYLTPPADRGFGGSDAYDIYLLDIGNGDSNDTYYGMTNPEFPIKNPKTQYDSYTSYIWLDNDFSPFDSTAVTDKYKVQTFSSFGIDGLKITAVHEFHHAIQFSYAEYIPSAALLHELTSTWMEYRFFPEVKDYYQYVRSLFKFPNRYPFGDALDSQSGYRWAIFGQYIYKNYGDSLLLRMWELVGDGLEAYMALDSAFKERGSNLITAFGDFIPWLYYTGSRAKAGDYFEDAAEFPEMKFYINEIFSSPSFSESNNMQSFEVRPFRCIFPAAVAADVTNDTLDFFLLNIDLNAAIGRFSSDKLYSFSITDSYQPDSKQISNTVYYFLFNAEQDKTKYFLFFNSGILTKGISYAYPNPFNPNLDEAILFPVSDGAPLESKARLIIYTIDMSEVYSAVLRVEAHGENKVVPCRDFPRDLSSGIYIYSITYKDISKVGKFAVIKSK